MIEEKRNYIVCAIFWLLAVQCSWDVVSSATTANRLPVTASSGDNNNNKPAHPFGNVSQLLYAYDDDEADYDDVIDDPDYPRIIPDMMDYDDETNNHEWDVLLFTQQWPMTSCLSWKEEDKSHTCSLPGKKDIWTIHGIWPTKYHTIGPSFCNKSADFDLNQLEAIRSSLDEYWPTIHGGPDHSDTLWRHEWLKHGTCAMLLQDLSNEMRYFSRGLKWRDSYRMTQLLSEAGIQPGSNNTVIALNTALVNAIGKNPSIHCMHDNRDDVSYLLEIRICFDKSLELTDCDGVTQKDVVQVRYPGGSVLTNCQVSKPVFYPSQVPPVAKPESDWKFPVVNLYKLIQFIMWFTL